MYRATFNIDIHRFGTIPTGSEDDKREKIRRERMVFDGFGSFIVTVPRKAKDAHISMAHAERAVRAVRGYYQHMN